MSDHDARLSAALADRYRIEHELGAGGDAPALDFAGRNPNGQRRGALYLLSLADTRIRQVLRFDEPSHPHRHNVDGIALRGSVEYFPLGSAEGNIWTVQITGLAK